MCVTWLKDRPNPLHTYSQSLQRMSTEPLYQALRFAHHRWGPSPESPAGGQEGAASSLLKTRPKQGAVGTSKQGGWLEWWPFISPSSTRLEIKALENVSSSEASLVRRWPPPHCVCLWHFFFRSPRHTGAGPTSATWFYLDSLIDGFVSKCSHIRKHRELGLEPKILTEPGPSSVRHLGSPVPHTERSEKKALHTDTAKAEALAPVASTGRVVRTTITLQVPVGPGRV